MTNNQGSVVAWSIVAMVIIAWAMFFMESRAHAQPYFREADGGMTRWSKDAGS